MRGNVWHREKKGGETGREGGREGRKREKRESRSSLGLTISPVRR